MARSSSVVREVGTIADASRLGWDALVSPDDPYHTSSWLGIESAQTNVPPRYFLGWAAEKPAGPADAALSCYPLDASSEPWPFMRIDRVLLHRLQQASPPAGAGTETALAQLLPTYLCGGRRVADTRVLVDVRRPVGERRELIGDLLDHLERDARAQGVRSLSFLFVHEGDTVLREALAARGYLEFRSARYGMLPLCPPTFDAYLGRLTGHRRREVNRERRLLAAAGVRFAVEPMSAEVIGEMVPLQLQHDRRYGHAVTAEALEQNLRLHVDHCGDAVGALTARSPDGVLRGCAVLIRWGPRLVVRQAGFDYAWQGKLPLYFGVCYYAAIEHACRTGAALMDYSIEAEATKRTRGCELEARYCNLKLLEASGHSQIELAIEQIRQAQGGLGQLPTVVS
jgi:hypothetical protein